MKYYIPDWGETRDDAREVPMGETTLFADTAAEFAADEIFNMRDGWEANWPLDIVIVFDNHTEQTFEVHREAVPNFIAYKKNKAPL